jgi:hypothetical protein
MRRRPLRSQNRTRNQREGDDGFKLQSEFVQQFGFEIVRDGHLAGGDLLRCGADEAEFAVAQAFGAVVIGRANRRSEDAASHRTPGVDVAPAGGGVERGTGCVVGEAVEFFLVLDGFSKCADVGIAGKIGAVLGEPGLGAAFDRCGEFRIGYAQRGHASAKARSVERVDGECAVAALRASNAAGEQISGTARCVGERGIDDLDEFGVARRKRHEGKDTR